LLQPSIKKRFENKTCTVVGLGISNLPLIDFLLLHGARVTGRDKKPRHELGEIAADLEARGVRLCLGDGYLDEICEDVIFRTPGLRPDHPALAAAVARGAILTSEMELFLELTPATVLGITGSDGKTTTTTLTGLILEAECRRRGTGRVFVGGNIGTPLLPLVTEMTAEDFAVVELSSFQLQTATRSVHDAVVTNVTPNHLNWHIDMDEYILAKTNIYRHSPCRRLVTNAENEITRTLAAAFAGKVTLFSSKKHKREEFSLPDGGVAIYERDGVILLDDGKDARAVVRVEDILLPGVHNLENYMTAIALTAPYASRESVEQVARSFGGVPHRLERVRVLDGVTYYNSSIDSTPTRTAAALSALTARPIVICGGYDKHVPFEPLAEALCRRASAVILTGATAKKIREALDGCKRVQSGDLPIYEEADFVAAVTLSRRIASPGDVVLLSPACASFDAFKNFEERGETFRRTVLNFS